MILYENTPKTPNKKTSYGYGIIKDAMLAFSEAGVDLKGKSEEEIVGAFLALNGMKTEDEYTASKMGKNDGLTNGALIREALADIGEEKNVSQMDISEVVKEYMQKKGYKSVEDFENKVLKRGANKSISEIFD